MYFCIMSNRNLKVGEVAVLKFGNDGQLGCYLIDGTFAGHVCARQPEGCMSFWEIASAVGNKKIISFAAIKAGKVIIMQSNSKAFERRAVRRVEVEGYGMMVTV